MKRSIPDKEYPRVVIVAGNPLRRDMPNGIMLSSFFDGWPRDRLAEIYFPTGFTYLPHFDVCQEFSMIRTSGRVSRLTAPASQECATTTVPIGEKHTSAVRRWQWNMLNQVRRTESLMGALRTGREFWYAYSWIGRMLERELCHLRPEIVYANLGNFSMTRITCLACKRLGIPMHLHIGDDFIHALYRGMPLEKSLQSLSEYWFRQAVEYADGLETVNPIAVEEFERRYGGEWCWFAALSDPDRFDRAPRIPEDVVRLVYAGSLGIGRWRSIRQLALILQSLHRNQGIETQLDIYCTPEHQQQFGPDVETAGITRWCGWVSHDALPRVLNRSDILVHVESLDPDASEIARFSFSTKLSDYLMAGRCILAFGPKEFASMEMVRRAKAGITVDLSDAETLEVSLASLLRDRSQRDAFGRSARTWGKKWFDRNARREDFRREIVASLHRARMRQEPTRRAA